MANQLVKRFVYNGGTESFTVPAGFNPSVTAYVWGAGGGGGSKDGGGGDGGIGGAGFFLKKDITLNASDRVTVAVGGGGYGGRSGSGYGYGAGGGSYADSTSWSTLDIASNPNNLRVTNGAYVDFLNQYGVWNYNSTYPVFDQSYTINFALSGYYNIVGACDNYATIYIDGAQVLSIPGFQGTYSNNFYVTAGAHTIRLYGINTGGPGSLAVSVSSGRGGGNRFCGSRGGNAGPGGWSGSGGGGGGASLVLVNGDVAACAGGGGGGGGGSNYRPGYSAGSSIVTSGSTVGGDCPGDGGGGGGGGGGLSPGNGGEYGYDGWRGGLAGSPGTSSPGETPPRSGRYPSGTDFAYWRSPIAYGGQGGDTTVGEAGMEGMVVLVFDSTASGQIKVHDAWNTLKSTSVKVGGAWRTVTGTWVKNNGIWAPVATGSPADIQTTFSTANFV